MNGGVTFNKYSDVTVENITLLLLKQKGSLKKYISTIKKLLKP